MGDRGICPWPAMPAQPPQQEEEIARAVNSLASPPV